MHHELPSLTFIPESNGAAVAFFSLTDAESIYVEGHGYTYGPRDLLIERNRHGLMMVTEVEEGTGAEKWTDYTVVCAIDAHRCFRINAIEEALDALSSVSADVEDLVSALFTIEEADESSEDMSRKAREARWAIGSLQTAVEDERYALADARDSL